MSANQEHKLTLHKQGTGMNGQCACGEWFLTTYVFPKRKRASILQQHSEHLATQRLAHDDDPAADTDLWDLKNGFAQS